MFRLTHGAIEKLHEFAKQIEEATKVSTGQAKAQSQHAWIKHSHVEATVRVHLGICGIHFVRKVQGSSTMATIHQE